MEWICRIKKGLSDRLEEEKELEHIRKIVRQERLIYELEAIVAGSAEIIKEAIEQIIHAGVKKREMKKLIKYLNKEGEEKPIIAYYAGKVCNRSGIPLELGYYRYAKKSLSCLKHRTFYSDLQACYQKLMSSITDEEIKGRLDMLIEEYREMYSKILQDQKEFFAMGYYSAIGLKEYAEAKHTVKIPSSILLRETLE